jgi:hypothetical protein
MCIGHPSLFYMSLIPPLPDHILLLSAYFMNDLLLNSNSNLSLILFVDDCSVL